MESRESQPEADELASERGRSGPPHALQPPAEGTPTGPLRSLSTSGVSKASSGVAGRIAMRTMSAVAIGVLLIYLRPILMPLMLGVLVALLISPIVKYLVRRGLPGILAILVGEVAGVLPILGLITIFFATAGPLSRQLPKYQQQLTAQINSTVDWVVDRVDTPEAQQELRRELRENLVPKVIEEGMTFARNGMATATAGAGYFFLMLLFTTFLLMEGRRLQEKVREAFGRNNAVLVSMSGIAQDVRNYVVAKTVISLGTGMAVWGFLALMGVDFALFWGLLAFPLNFIPTVGAIAASLPPVLVAWVDPEMGAFAFVFVIVGLGAINGVIGSFLDPRLVGRSVELSPLVVFVSMVVWGLLWGPIGMLMAVPLMVSIKLVCSHVRGLEPIAILLKA